MSISSRTPRRVCPKPVHMGTAGTRISPELLPESESVCTFSCDLVGSGRRCLALIYPRPPSRRKILDNIGIQTVTPAKALRASPNILDVSSVMGVFEELGYLWQVVAQLFPGKPHFKTEDIPDLTGKVVIVTGGNVGIGRETIKALLQHNAKVYMASRNKDKATAAIQALKEETGKEAIFLELDLSVLASVRKAAAEFLSKEPELHILFNNAGVMWCPIEWVTADGFDMQFGTNVIGHFLFTELLMPALFAGTSSSPDHHARVVTTASSGAYLNTLDWDTFKDTSQRKKTSPVVLYNQSKLANAIVARQVAKQYADKGIISISLNPGGIDTELQRHAPKQRAIMRATILQPVAMGALTQLWAGVMPEALNHNGEFLIPWARLGKCRKEAYDDEVGQRLWAWLLEQTKEI
ncbi:uncharacterized protein C8Q71DRAFT_775100 [Rhodofomes roseus]|uniref:NAD(P)-binding protein n=1 Tax=Rhodofomes roseus TaxID=34475 RepID=A0ABQ8K7S7_9APHY|nr:uncharacterized protein C8Q71DRAFT_775100 [Rhodofomes roseus]KAH9833337.1 hypothetical protein C8Q71DRAFT_775100 [Rhodofomes roseus]